MKRRTKYQMSTAGTDNSDDRQNELQKQFQEAVDMVLEVHIGVDEVKDMTGFRMRVRTVSVITKSVSVLAGVMLMLVSGSQLWRRRLLQQERSASTLNRRGADGYLLERRI